ncbi:hypothetical protein BTA51_26885 [Hahella sp. CCB-MM4]|uniref:DUF2878 domain-containing protein n=1 Tax=Hahella sp. (strain CCB-MM4) TaxID=1926491 RepID=UPI000B9C4552|nr:DUF2878 domain-containing protein [Hahella sp. CCB-MM4]OZG70231.1 hypothetical protein BTA51_26885 [Hahella sp. CCB-MM4]
MSSTTKINMIGNATLMTALWYSSVVGAAHQADWPSPTALVALMAWSFIFGKQIQADMRMAFIGLLIAFAVEPIWIGTGLIDYRLQPSASYPPLWIACLWAGFSLSFNHSMKWLKGRYLLAAGFGILGAPISLYSAHLLGALDAPVGWGSLLMVYLPVWGILIPALAWLSGIRTSDEAQRDEAT